MNIDVCIYLSSNWFVLLWSSKKILLITKAKGEVPEGRYAVLILVTVELISFKCVYITMMMMMMMIINQNNKFPTVVT